MLHVSNFTTPSSKAQRILSTLWSHHAHNTYILSEVMPPLILAFSKLQQRYWKAMERQKGQFKTSVLQHQEIFWIKRKNELWDFSCVWGGVSSKNVIEQKLSSITRARDAFLHQPLWDFGFSSYNRKVVDCRQVTKDESYPLEKRNQMMLTRSLNSCSFLFFECEIVMP